MQPFYIGKGKNLRYKDHLKGNNFNKHFVNTINKIRYKTGHDPIIQIYKDNLKENEAFDLEIYLINLYGRVDNNTGILTNLTNGGDGPSGRVATDKTKETASIIHKNMISVVDNNGNYFKVKNDDPKWIDGNYKASAFGKTYKHKCPRTYEHKKRISDKIKEIGGDNYKIVYPNGEEKIIKNLKKFCRDNNLTYSVMRKVVYGERNHHKQFKCFKL